MFIELTEILKSIDLLATFAYMKKSIIQQSAFLLLVFMVFSASAQEIPAKKKGALEISVGFNAVGPAREMDKIMVENGFDATTSGNLFGGGGSEVEHPYYDKIGFSAQLSYTYRIRPKCQVGLLVNYSTLSEIFGATDDGALLFIRFSNVSIIPVYRYDLAKVLELQAGPALMINFGNKTSSTGNIPEDDTKVSPGLLCGLSLKIWDRQVTYGKIGAHYLFAAKSKMGPYTTANYVSELSTLPESDIGFGHLIISFSFGFHL
jgi:hypothetical protein